MFSSHHVAATEFSCPAKLNLLLAVTGRRPDGFHELVSVVAPVEFGDTLTVEAAEEFSLACDDPAVPTDATNLVLKAAAAFRAATGWKGGARFTLAKRIPMGAGLGGGSSNAATTLVALNALAGGPMTTPALARVAAQVGSDCPLFLARAPVAMRGRGEQVEPLPTGVAAHLRGRRVLIFKPGFGIATPWAYAQLAASAAGAGASATPYLPTVVAEARLEEFIRKATAGEEWTGLTFNSLERPAFGKYVALPTLFGRLQERFGLTARMSGSGSACFLFVSESTPVAKITAAIHEAWGASAFVVETRLV